MHQYQEKKTFKLSFNIGPIIALLILVLVTIVTVGILTRDISAILFIFPSLSMIVLFFLHYNDNQIDNTNEEASNNV